MARTFSIQISDTDYKALQHIAANPEEWFDNMVESRAHAAKLDIQKIYVEYKTSRGESIPGGGLDAQVDAAFSEGVVRTMAESNAMARPPGQ